MRPTSGDWRRLALVAVALAMLVVAVVGAAPTDDQPSGDAVLNDTRERYANAESVVTTAEVTVSNATENATATVEFAAAGNQSRVVVDTDNGTYRAGVNETVAWYVAPNRTAAWERDALGRPATPVGNGSLAASLPNRSDHNYTVEYLRRGSDDGTDAHVVAVTPDDGDARTTLWVATTDARLLRAEVTDGTNTTVVDYRDTRFNASVHGSTFDPPSDRIGITSVDRYGTFDAAQTNTSLALPRLDATFEEATVVTRSSETHVAQNYRAGDNVTVVSTTTDREFDENATRVTVNGHDANVTTVRDRAVVYWRSDGVTTAVVVDASRERAVELANKLDE